MGSDWLETQEESDARTIVGHLVLKNILQGITEKPDILVDLMDVDNVRLFQSEKTETLVTPMMSSHVLAQVALRRELNVVYAELFGAGGAEVVFRPVSEFGVTDREIAFGTLQEVVYGRGEIALGVHLAKGAIELNPEHDKTYLFKELDNLIVLVQEDRA
jgi:hypothetical protein